MSDATIPAEVPDAGTPIFNQAGYIDPVWHEFFFTLLRRTGGTEGLVPVTQVSGAAPIVSSGGTTPEISITPATSGAAGSMSGPDKGKLDTVQAGAAVASVGASSPITSSGGFTPSIGILAATTVAPGSMSASDKAKLDSITGGAAVASVSGTAPIVSSGGATPAISITPATSGAAGSMSASDKGKLDTIAANAAVASVSGTAPITSSGGATPAIGISAATGAAAGSMSAADKAKLDSMAYTEGTWTPVLTFTTPGNLAVTYSSQVGYYTRVGRTVTLHFVVSTSAFTHTTASGELRVTGVPLPLFNDPALEAVGQLSWRGSPSAGYTDVCVEIAGSVSLSQLRFMASGSGLARQALSTGQAPSGSVVSLAGQLTYIV